ncbi:MAG: hypothetical protein AB8B93_18270 [Pseudomonadales bacterium]
MTTIALIELDNCKSLSTEQMQATSGGLSADLQYRYNQLGAVLQARERILFNPTFIYNTIRSSQQAWRGLYGRQMPYFFPMPRW